MSHGSVLMGLVAAVGVSASLAAAGPSDEKSSNPKRSSHEVAASSYETTFMPSGPHCAVPSGSEAINSAVLHGNPFVAYNGGSGSYAGLYFGSSGGGPGGSGSEHHGGIAGLPESSHSPSNDHGPSYGGQPGNGQPGAPGAPGASGPGRHSGGPFGTIPGPSAGHPSPFSPSPNPEPATLILLSTGIGGLVIARRRGRKN